MLYYTNQTYANILSHERKELLYNPFNQQNYIYVWNLYFWSLFYLWLKLHSNNRLVIFGLLNIYSYLS